MSDNELLAKLQTENARLIALLESHGIDWRPSITASPLETEPSRLSTGDKVALFRRLFRGRTDVYPIRWESKTTGKSGYAPACANEWRAGVCEKPRIKCSDCPNRLLLPLSDAVIYGHLAGEHTVGVYPLLEDDSCYFLAVDFDEAAWQEDARAFLRSCDAELLDLVEMEVRELLTRQGFPGDSTAVVGGSALLALEGNRGELGVPSIIRLVAEMDRYIPLPDRVINAPFLLRIEDVYSIAGRGTVVTAPSSVASFA